MGERVSDEELQRLRDFEMSARVSMPQSSPYRPHVGKCALNAEWGDMRPRILDLFSGAGGSAMGYSLAGFEVVGVDHNRQPHYPFEFHHADALEYASDPGLIARCFDAIHASPPCQAYTRKNANWGRERNHWIEHPDLLAPTRELLKATGLPYVIENVIGAPIDGAIVLCGTMFGLRIQKHRAFEVNWPLPVWSPGECDHRDTYNPWSGAGRSADKLREAQGTPWIPMAGGASRKAGYTGDCFNAIPPAYTEWIGTQLLASMKAAARATSSTSRRRVVRSPSSTATT